MAANLIVLVICSTVFVMSAMFVYPDPFVAVWNGTLDGMIWIVDRLIAWTEA